MKNNVFRFLAIVLLCVGLSSVSFAKQVSKKPQAPKLEVSKAKPTIKLCTDFETKIDVKGMTIGNKGVVKIQGLIRNNGPGDYSGRSFDGIVTYQAWYPPKTPVQSSDTGIVIKKTLGTKLKNQRAINLNTQQSLPKFTRWGHFPANKIDRPAVRIFIIKVEPTFTGSPTPLFNKCEDMNSNNSTAVSVEIKYMISVK
ncbi:MAG: hypothetical protein GY707_16625 [Desulfobacteraceae bacterium]|nr:hypothetical protein [Desulfobacteraceae bacterium]